MRAFFFGIQDKDSGLYGLYDGLSITKKCIYNDISYDEVGGFFTLIRGSEEEEYVPVSVLRNETNDLEEVREKRRAEEHEEQE